LAQERFARFGIQQHAEHLAPGTAEEDRLPAEAQVGAIERQPDQLDRGGAFESRGLELLTPVAGLGCGANAETSAGCNVWPMSRAARMMAWTAVTAGLACKAARLGVPRLAARA